MPGIERRVIGRDAVGFDELRARQPPRFFTDYLWWP
jgi:hypothetical protein